MAIRGVLFDKDGTLIDFAATWEPVLQSLAHEFARGDHRLASELMARAGFDHRLGAFAAGSVWAAGNTLDLVAAWLPGGGPAERAALARRVDDYCASVGPASAVPITDLRRLLAGLRASGLALGVATNDVTRSAVATMERLGVGGLLTAVLGYDAVVNPKPAADMVLAFAAAAGIRPGEVAVVGDNVHDLAMARAAGAGLAVGVLSGNSARHELGPHADQVIATIDDLPDLLGRLARPSPLGAADRAAP